MNRNIIILKRLLKLIEVSYTSGYLEDAVLSNPNSSSLQCISDVLDLYNVDNMTIKVDVEKLNELLLPAVVQVLNDDEVSFCVLKEIKANFLVLFDQKGVLKKISKKKFFTIWTGIALLVQKNDSSVEPYIDSSYRIKRTTVILSFILLGLLGILVYFTSGPYLLYDPIYHLFIVTKIIGLVVSLKLLLYENRIVPNNFCKRSGRIDCDAVLESKYSRLFGGTINLSFMAFAYFCSTTLCVLFYDNSKVLVSMLSFATIPMVLYSLYSQVLVLKKWCVFCLGIIGVLLLENLIVFLEGYYVGFIDLVSIIGFMSLYVSVLMICGFLSVYLKTKRDKIMFKRSLLRFKSRKNVFNSFLLESRKITSSDGIGFSFKNSNANYKIILVVNLYCKFCANAFYEAKRLYDKGLIDFRVIFSVPEDIDKSKMVVSHILAYATINDPSEVLKMINSWFTSGKKDYKWLSSQYPINIDISAYDQEVRDMNYWCEDQNIDKTPAIFIDETELPKEYNIKDLKWVLAT